MKYVMHNHSIALLRTSWPTKATLHLHIDRKCLWKSLKYGSCIGETACYGLQGLGIARWSYGWLDQQRDQVFCVRFVMCFGLVEMLIPTVTLIQWRTCLLLPAMDLTMLNGLIFITCCGSSKHLASYVPACFMALLFVCFCGALLLFCLHFYNQTVEFCFQPW